MTIKNIVLRGELMIDEVFLIIALLSVVLTVYWKYKAESYRELAKEWKLKHDDLEREVKILRRKVS